MYSRRLPPSSPLSRTPYAASGCLRHDAGSAAVTSGAMQAGAEGPRVCVHALSHSMSQSVCLCLSADGSSSPADAFIVLQTLSQHQRCPTTVICGYQLER